MRRGGRSFGVPKDLRLLLEAAEAQGWTFSRRKGAHIKGVHFATGRTVTVSATASDWRAICNIKSDLGV